MSRAVVFGISGQDGHYLNRLLAEQGVECIGVARREGPWLCADVADYAVVESIINRYRPEYVFHLAAESSTRHEHLFANHAAIATGSLNILESVKKFSPSTRVFLSGSAMQFANQGEPINEQTPFEARSPYAVSRIQATYAGRYYRDVCGISVYTGFFFNHDSPLRSERHINQKIAAVVERIAGGSTEKLNIGNVDVCKEFTFAGDTVRAVWMLVNNDSVYEAVIGSGIVHSIAEWLEYCFGSRNLQWRDHVHLDASFQPEYKCLVSDPALLMSLGWAPRMSFTGLADMMLNALNDAG